MRRHQTVQLVRTPQRTAPCSSVARAEPRGSASSSREEGKRNRKTHVHGSSPPQTCPRSRQGSVLPLILVEVLVLVVVLPSVRHGGLHPGPAVLRPAGARGQRPVRAVGQVTARTGGVSGGVCGARDGPASPGGPGVLNYTNRNGKPHPRAAQNPAPPRLTPPVTPPSHITTGRGPPAGP